MKGAPAVVVVSLSALLGGCLAPFSGAGAPLGATPAPAARLAVGCDTTRPALVIHPRGPSLVDNNSSLGATLPIPCFSRTGFSGAYEPTLGVDPKSGSVYYFPVHTASGPGGAQVVQVVRSADGGRNWAPVGPTVGSLPSHPLTVDPYFYLDPATGRIFADDDVSANCAEISFSDDGGASWTNSLTGCLTLDHQTIFAGPPVTSLTTGYPRIVYRCAYEVSGDGAGLTSSCLKSLTGGSTWMPTGAPAFGPALGPGNAGVPACDPALGHGASGPDGAIYVPSGICGVPQLAISRDEGTTWATVRVSDAGEPLTSYGMYGHEAGVGADRLGNVYFGWIGADRLPRLAISHDGGKTWDPPLLLAVPGLREASLPELIVGGPGKVAMVFMGSTNAPMHGDVASPCAGTGEAGCLQGSLCPMYGLCLGSRTIPESYANATWNGYIAESGDALASHPSFYVAPANNPAQPIARGNCDPNGCQAENDFLDIRLGPDGSPWISLVDGCEGACLRGPGPNDASEGAVGHLFGGPNLLDSG